MQASHQRHRQLIIIIIMCYCSHNWCKLLSTSIMNIILQLSRPGGDPEVLFKQEKNLPSNIKNPKAYIPLRRKNTRAGSLHWLRPPRRNFALEMPTCCYLKMLKSALPPTRILKFALPPTRNPNASQWNIGCVGSQTQNSCVGHVHIFFLC